jgi:putative ATPase
VVEHAKGLDRPTLLFVDEIHRFNKGQQDAFLPHVEAGTIALVGATTENPSFYLTSALLSRCRVVVLKALSQTALEKISRRGEVELGIELDDEARHLFVEASNGDGRRLLNLLEAFSDHGVSAGEPLEGRIDAARAKAFISESGLSLYDRSGEEHYNIASAFIKSLRGSDPDAALYWGFRMLDGGEDPRFVIRRLVIFAAEDIGNADPRALQVAVSTLQAYDLVGLPEGRIPIAQCITYLATAPKSNRSYVAMHRALKAIKDAPAAPVPVHLRNAPTGLMKGLGYGADYVYPHDTQYGYAPGVKYLPDEVRGRPFYEPSDRGNEKTIKERIQWLEQVSKGAGKKG